jgi:hypothetical protein
MSAALTSAALIGAARAGLPPADSLPPALATLHRELAGRPPQEALFLLAGAAALYLAAGRLPERIEGDNWRLPAFRPEGDLPPCSPAAARLLESMFNPQHSRLLPEMLDLLAAAGQRAPDALLPTLLEHGAKIPRLRPQLLPILGERGRWLAAINPAWRYAAFDPADPRSLHGVWDADPAGRPPLAQTLRARDPAAARRLIAATWRAEPDATRRALLGALETGLSMADEPFLERALDDRDAATRRKAADLLAGLPDSRLVRRVTAAAGDILVLTDGRLTPNFPRPVSDALARDGVARPESDAQPGATRTATEWARLLAQTVGVIPPAHWRNRFGQAPEALAAAAKAGRWPRTLLAALAAAALRHRDRGWIEALLAIDGYSERLGVLLAALEPAEAYARLAERLAAGDEAATVVFLRRWPGAWDEASGRLLIDFMSTHAAVAPDTRQGPTLRFLSRQFAQHCPPQLADYAGGAAGRAAGKAWEAAFSQLAATLRLRHEIMDAVRL